MELIERNGWIYQGNTDERYVLGQTGIRNMVVFGINPSTAVPGKDDPTIRKVRKLTSTAGYDGWIIVNLYPQITSHPENLHEAADKSLLLNNIDTLKLLRQQYRIDAVWAAWGDAINIRPYLRNALIDLNDTLDESVQWFYRGKMTKKGNPRHPLYMSEGEDFRRFLVSEYVKYHT